MKTLVKNVQLTTENNHPHVDILIEHQKIVAIQHEITTDDNTEVNGDGTIVLPSFIDTFCFSGEPGFENQETYETLSKSALAGGYTTVACLPNTKPCLQTKAQVENVYQQSSRYATQFIPLGAVTIDCKGIDMTEMYDMHSGCVSCFTDGAKPLSDEGFILRVLQYLKPINATLINTPIVKKLSQNAMIHESENSVQLGMKGVPTMAETLAVQRDIMLSAYTKSKLHIANITCAESVDIIRKAKSKGSLVTCSVNAMNLIFTDTVYHSFDSLYKVSPIIRSENDRNTLIEGLIDGTIDMINTNHVAVDLEGKEVEFEYAQFGANLIEYTFSACWNKLKNSISWSRLNEIMNVNPAKLLQIESNKIEVGAPANFILIEDTPYILTNAKTNSKGIHTPFLHQPMQGKIIATFSKGVYCKNNLIA